MKINCDVKIDYKNGKEADVILKSIEVDNLEYIKSKIKGNAIEAHIESKSISSLIHTLDDYLACISIAEKIIKKKEK
jgi:tRNA threonylcarbamoyladenosine modification (KEOPS) complex  Pcc1 subunit